MPGLPPHPTFNIKLTTLYHSYQNYRSILENFWMKIPAPTLDSV